MKKTIQILSLVIFWLLSISLSPPDSLTISITDKGDRFLPTINDTKFNGALTLDDFEKLIGKPDRIVKQSKGKKRCSGLGGRCGTKIPVPKRRFIYYDKLGLELIGTDAKDIFAIKIYFDTTGLASPTQGLFQGQLVINDVEIEPKKALTDLETIEEREYEDVLGNDPINCGQKCKTLNTIFRHGRSLTWLGIYILDNDKKNSRISITYNKDKEITSVTYYK